MSRWVVAKALLALFLGAALGVAACGEDVVGKVAGALEGVAKGAQEVERAGVPSAIGVRVVNELHGLRRTLTRMNVISRTGFLATGYALLETLTAIIVGLLMISRFKSLLARPEGASCWT